MNEKNKQPTPITMNPIAHRAHFLDALDRPILVPVRGVEGLGALLRFIGKNRAEGFYDRGLTCFHLNTGIPVAGVFGNCPSVASLISVSKKGGEIFARLRLLQVERADGSIYTQDGDGEGGQA